MLPIDNQLNLIEFLVLDSCLTVIKPILLSKYIKFMGVEHHHFNRFAYIILPIDNQLNLIELLVLDSCLTLIKSMRLAAQFSNDLRQFSSVCVAEIHMARNSITMSFYYYWQSL